MLIGLLRAKDLQLSEEWLQIVRNVVGADTPLQTGAVCRCFTLDALLAHSDLITLMADGVHGESAGAVMKPSGGCSEAGNAAYRSRRR